MTCRKMDGAGSVRPCAFDEITTRSAMLVRDDADYEGLLKWIGTSH